MKKQYVGMARISRNKGITLIALIITIIVMLILVGVTVNVALNGGLFDAANEAKFKEELSMMNEEYQVYLANKKLEESDFEIGGLYIYDDTYRYKGELQIGAGIKTAIPNIPEKHKKDVEVIKGELYYVSTDGKKLKWAEEIGMKLNPYLTDKETGTKLLSNDYNLLLVDENGRLVIPETVRGKTITTIAEGAFSKKPGLKEIVIPGTIKTIEKNAFSNNPTLEKVIIEEGLETIGGFAFYNCASLKDVQMPDSVIELGGSAFKECTSLQNIKLSKGLKVIRQYTFDNCKSIKSIIIPEGVTTIEESAFRSLLALVNMQLPQTITEIKAGFISSCPLLKNLDIDKKNLNYFSENGILFNKDGTRMIFIAEGAISGSKTFVVPDTVTDLTGNLLENYPSITKVVIPANVTNINHSFFTQYINEIEIDEYNQNYLTLNGAIYNSTITELVYYFKNESNFTVENGVTTIGPYAFRRAKNLLNITLPESLTTIKNSAFEATSLETLNLGSKVQFIEMLAFYSSKIKQINIDPDNEFFSFENGTLYNKDKTVLVYALTPGEKYIIPKGVVEIAPYAIYFKQNIKEIEISETVEKIGASFNGCTGLTSIKIPNNVKSISSSCFDMCTKLEKIIVDNKEGEIPGAPWGAPTGDRAMEYLR